ncbi:MAG TPA: hypothetical protein VFA68_21020 [Terriglobales bacterium]|nr:hypothetical protein [Terriglobales bacterium]
MSKRKRNEARPDELGNNPAQVGLDSAGQSGDNQELSNVEEALDQSVDDLVETGQDFEANVAQGVEDAGDEPEREVRTHQDPRYRPTNEGPTRENE